LPRIPDRGYFDRISAEMGFSAWPLEKLYRIMEILYEVNIGELNEYLALRGGTAINLCYTQLPRLSIDIDFVLTRDGDRNNMMRDRAVVRRRIMGILESGGYETDPHLDDYALDRFEAKYKSIFGSADRLKVEINYISSRIPIYPPTDAKPLNVFGTSLERVRTLSTHEIYGSKIEALIKRHAPRDLFDVNMLVKGFGHRIDVSKLRKCTIFSCCVEIPWDFRADLAHNPADIISEKDVRDDLRPYLTGDRGFDLSEAKKTVGDFCSKLFKLGSEESEFLRALFEDGKCLIDLLFPSAGHLRDHPGMKWRLQQLSGRSYSDG
jgi:predicted nucleotidyltransferase component of viral defense system